MYFITYAFKARLIVGEEWQWISNKTRNGRSFLRKKKKSNFTWNRYRRWMNFLSVTLSVKNNTKNPSMTSQRRWEWAPQTQSCNSTFLLKQPNTFLCKRPKPTYVADGFGALCRSAKNLCKLAKNWEKPLQHTKKPPASIFITYRGFTEQDSSHLLSISE